MNDSLANARVLRPAFRPRPSSAPRSMPQSYASIHQSNTLTATPRAVAPTSAALPQKTSERIFPQQQPTPAPLPPKCESHSHSHSHSHDHANVPAERVQPTLRPSSAASARVGPTVQFPASAFERAQGKRIFPEHNNREQPDGPDWRPGRRVIPESSVVASALAHESMLSARRRNVDVKMFADHDPLGSRTAESAAPAIPVLSQSSRATGRKFVDTAAFTAFSKEENALAIARKKRVDAAAIVSEPVRTHEKMGLKVIHKGQPETVSATLQYQFAGRLHQDQAYAPKETERRSYESAISAGAKETMAANVKMYQYLKSRAHTSTSALTDPLYDKKP